MPARPLSNATVQLIHALRDSLEAGLVARAMVPSDGNVALEERTLFGSYCFFVDGKLCIGVKGEALLVRLPPHEHARYAEHQGLRELSPTGGMQGYFWVDSDAYQRRSDWLHWVDAALDYNPQAKASPKKARKPAADAPATNAPRAAAAKRSAKKSSSSAPAALQRPTTPISGISPAGRKKGISPTATASTRKHSVFDDDDVW